MARLLDVDELKKTMFKRGLCERCLAKGIIKQGRKVHHKIRLTPDNILNLDNLELLCDECYQQEFYNKGWEVNEDGTISRC